VEPTREILAYAAITEVGMLLDGVGDGLHPSVYKKRRQRIWVIEEEKNGERIVRIGAQNPYRNTRLSALLLFSE
jgi:hypothetical protein